MEYRTKEKIYLIGILVGYILLGISGIYSTTLIFLFPILAAPLTLYLLRYRGRTSKCILLHLIIVLGIMLLTANMLEAIVYLIAVAVPSHIFEMLYRRRIPVPQIVMYVGVGTIGAFFLYVSVMKYMGVDYIQYYMTALDEYKELQLQLINELSKMTSDLREQEGLTMFKDLIHAQVLVMETIYPAMFLLIGIFLGIVHMVIITIIGRIKRWQMQSLKQMGQFTFSKNMGILLIIAIIVSQVGIGEKEQLLLLGINLFFFISSLLEVLGLLVLCVLIKRNKWSMGIKSILILGLFTIMTAFPQAFMIIGLADTFFNFRKINIIV